MRFSILNAKYSHPTSTLGWLEQISPVINSYDSYKPLMLIVLPCLKCWTPLYAFFTFWSSYGKPEASLSMAQIHSIILRLMGNLLFILRILSSGVVKGDHLKRELRRGDPSSPFSLWQRDLQKKICHRYNRWAARKAIKASPFVFS